MEKHWTGSEYITNKARLSFFFRGREMLYSLSCVIGIFFCGVHCVLLWDMIMDVGMTNC